MILIKLKRLTGFFLLSIGIPSSFIAQETKIEDPKQRLVISLEEGFNFHHKINYLTGQGGFEGRTGHQVLFYGGYQRLLNEAFSFTAEGGLGIQTVNYSYNEFFKQYFMNPLIGFRLSGDHALLSHKKSTLLLTFGTGINFSLGGNYSSAHFVYAAGSGGTQLQEQSIVTGSFSKIQGFVSPGIKLSRSMKNYDLLVISTRVNFLHQAPFSGHFELKNASSEGSYSGSNIQLQVGLAYCFTGISRNKEIEKIVLEEQVKPKEAKKEVLKSNRFFEPSSMFMQLSGGYYWGRTGEKGGNDFFQPVSYATSQLQLSAEKGFGNYFYLKGGVKMDEKAVAAKVWESNATVYLTKTKTSELYFSIGKRFKAKNNIQLCNLDAGMGVGVSWKTNGLKSTSMGTASYTNTGDTLFYFNSQSYQRNKVYPILQVGISRDFQLGNRLYFSVSYQQCFGLIPILYSDVEFKEGDQNFLPTKLVTNATSSNLLFGLKYRIEKRKIPKSHLD